VTVSDTDNMETVIESVESQRFILRLWDKEVNI
jgi:hypothetical protein